MKRLLHVLRIAALSLFSPRSPRRTRGDYLYRIEIATACWRRVQCVETRDTPQGPVHVEIHGMAPACYLRLDMKAVDRLARRGLTFHVYTS